MLRKVSSWAVVDAQLASRDISVVHHALPCENAGQTAIDIKLLQLCKEKEYSMKIKWQHRQIHIASTGGSIGCWKPPWSSSFNSKGSCLPFTQPAANQGTAAWRIAFFQLAHVTAGCADPAGRLQHVPPMHQTLQGCLLCCCSCMSYEQILSVHLQSHVTCCCIANSTHWLTPSGDVVRSLVGKACIADGTAVRRQDSKCCASSNSFLRCFSRGSWVLLKK